MKDTNEQQFKSKFMLALSVIFAAYIFLNIKDVIKYIGNIFSLLTPFIIGIAMAFVINLLMRIYEENIVKKIIRKKSMVRAVSLIITMATIITAIICIALFIVPQLIQSASTLVSSIQNYIEALEDTNLIYSVKSPEIQIAIENLLSIGEKFISTIGALTGSIVNEIVSIVLGFTTGVINIFMGFIIAIYILSSKEKLQVQGKKIIYAYMREEHADGVMRVCKISYMKFSKFIAGQCIEAVILGLMCFVGMSLLSMPYAVLISTIIGITALVPIFGALIGTVPSVFIIFMMDPMKALWFIVLIVVIQQIEGHLIYPFVVGHSIGLSGLWVLFAITIGGKSFGVVGMLLGVPIMGIIYTIFSEAVNERLKLKKINLSEK